MDDEANGGSRLDLGAIEQAKNVRLFKEITDRICGRGQGEELAYDLDIRIE